MKKGQVLMSYSMKERLLQEYIPLARGMNNNPTLLLMGWGEAGLCLKIRIYHPSKSPPLDGEMVIWGRTVGDSFFLESIEQGIKLDLLEHALAEINKAKNIIQVLEAVFLTFEGGDI